MSRRRLAVAAGILLALTGLVLRFVATGPLWLDEALSVGIARLPYGDLFEALRHDGSPPLYYLLLHTWLDLFGDGPVAVRSLSAVTGVLGVAATWAFAREVTASRRVAWVAALLAATSPFGIRYGSEARMYALVQLLVALGGWALARHLRRPSWGNAAAVATCSGLLLLTHYWALYLLAVVGLALLLRRRWRALASLAVGGVLFVPWLPSFAFQLANTGTPWAKRPPLGAVVDALIEWSGVGPVAKFLFVLLLGLGALGLLGAGVDRRRVELDLRGRSPGRVLAGVAFGTLLLGIVVGLVLGSGYAARYSAVAVVPFLVLAAVGSAALLDERVRLTVVALVAALGIAAGVPGAVKTRTQAGQIAAALRSQVRADDLVVYCPDQLGPAVARLLPPDTPQAVYPTGGAPHLVDWAGYAERNAAAEPTAFADEVLDTNGTIWLVVAGGYRTFGNDCDLLTEELRSARREEPIVRSKRTFAESAALVRFPP